MRRGKAAGCRTKLGGAHVDRNRTGTKSCPPTRGSSNAWIRHVSTWEDCPGETEFHLTHGDWIALLRDNGFSIERLLELQAPPRASCRFPWANPEWARRWPSEDAWVVRKR